MGVEMRGRRLLGGDDLLVSQLECKIPLMILRILMSNMLNAGTKYPYFSSHEIGQVIWINLKTALICDCCS